MPSGVRFSSFLRSGRLQVLAAFLALTLLLPASPVAAATPNRVYFSATGHYLAYGFLDYWLEHGGIPSFGYPLTEEFQQNGLTVQYFERAVFEYHPNNPDPYKVELRRLGADVTSGRQGEAPFQRVSAEDDPNCSYFQPTGHRLCFGFKDYWLQHGGLAIFGYPLTEEFTEGGYTVQYFERARFEYHPSNPPAWQVELGLLGDAAAQQNGVNTAPLGQAATVPVYSPSLWSGCQVSQLQAASGFAEGAAGTILETLTLKNISGDTCTLYGYPGLLLLDAQGNSLPTNVHWGHSGYPFLDVPPQQVFLIPGGTASFNVIYHDVPSSSPPGCSASSQVEITPPNDFDQLVIPAHFYACQGGELWVSPVVLGDQGVPR